MAEELELTPELLLQQSQEMNSLKTEYENLFSSIASDLKGINNSWSEQLSSNFSTKISSAQKSFSGVLTMLGNGSGALTATVSRMHQIDSSMASFISGNTTALGKGYTHIGFTSELAKNILDFYVDNFQTARETLQNISEFKDNFDQDMPSSLVGWIDKIISEAKEKVLDDNETVVDLAYSLIEGDYESFMEDLGEEGFKTVAKAYVKNAGLTVSDSDLGQYVKYAINVTENTAEAVTEFALEPSIENAGKVLWNFSVQPVLDTAGDKIYKVVNLIPGISEYYSDQDAEDIGGMASIALGDAYGLVTGDEGMKEYASNYYENAGGLWEGIFSAGEDVVSYVRDSGGVGEAVKNFAETAAKDSEGMFAHNWENLKCMASSSEGRAILAALWSTGVM